MNLHMNLSIAPLVALLAVAAPRPIAITIDYLPIASPTLHSTPAERAAITDGLLFEALAVVGDAFRTV